MIQNLKLIDPHEGTSEEIGGPFFEVAAGIRELLQSDYALVATVESDSLRVRAVAGKGAQGDGIPALDLISKLSENGPIVLDNSRLIAVPVRRGEKIIGALIGYSHESGTFTGEHLKRLVEYSQIAGDILDVRPSADEGQKRFSIDELLHFSRLITIGELSACFAHEVTNPLMLIRGHLRCLDETLPADSALRVSYEVIDRASRRIEEIARRMLDFSRKKTPRTESCDVAEIVSETLRFMQPYLQGQYIDVQIRLETALPLIQADRAHLVQALVNILQNAADAMAECDRRALTISGKPEGNHLRLAISDTGPGISPADMPRIFNPFFTTKGERGTGLGLYITKSLIEEHGGELRVETGDRGTTFVISLPL